jgi:outer membrane protein assembly factor BamD (BamD/ComL family)
MLALPNIFRLLLLFALVASPASAVDWPWSNVNQNQGPGTRDWWRNHKYKAEFVEGKGYRVPGVEGFFDGEGRYMTAPLDEVAIKLTGEAPETGLLPELDPMKNYGRLKEAVGLGPNQIIAQKYLQQGFELYQKQDYKAAEDEFKAAAGRWPDSQLEEQGLFYLGECYYMQGKYIKARDTYDKLVQQHPNTRRLDMVVDREWSIAKYWETHYFDYKEKWRTGINNPIDPTLPWFDKIGHSVKTYESIRLNDPTGPRADDAIMAAAGIYFRLERYGDADYHYSLLRSDYPQSDFQFEAHVLGLQAKLRMYQGPDYDGAPLDDAKVLARRLKTQFSGRLSDEERDRLNSVEAQVAQATETRDIQLAQYYDNTQHYGAARIIYEDVANKYGSSPVAAEARTRAEEIKPLPEKPAKPLGWLVEWAPVSTERTAMNDIPEVKQANEERLAQERGETGTVVK